MATTSERRTTLRKEHRLETALGALSTYELLAGILLHSQQRRFDEQTLLELCHEIQERAPRLRKTLQVHGVGGEYHSKPIARQLAMFRTYKFVDVPAPNPVPQPVGLRQSIVAELRKDLLRRKVLPKYAPMFRSVARMVKRTATTA